MKKYVGAVVFWGAMWGLFEATVGCLLHVMALHIGWLVWFPAAYFFMKAVYRQTGKIASVFQTALIATAIKTVDFLLPVRFDMVLNPIASIILEGLAVYAAYQLLERWKSLQRKELWYAVWGSFLPSVSWRFFYLAYVLTLPEYLILISPLRGVEPLVRFLVVDSLVNGAEIFLVLMAAAGMAQKLAASRNAVAVDCSDGEHGGNKLPGVRVILERICSSPLLVTSVLLLAVFVQWMV